MNNYWEDILIKSTKYNEKISEIKKNNYVQSGYYPYNSLSNFLHLKNLFQNNEFNMSQYSKILDIGCADGDTSFFLEELGLDVYCIDNAPTNYNNLNGFKKLHELLKSKVKLFELDIDTQFNITNLSVDIVFFLGIFYHLKNPYYILEKLSKISKYTIISTRIAKYTPDNNFKLENYPLAYLLSPQESNNDSTNYWILSFNGFLRICDRAGHKIRNYIRVGDTHDSNPSDNNHDERIFALLESKNYY